MINVTKTFFPPLGEYNFHLNRIWINEWLTNRGELVIELEAELKKFLGVENILVMNNGTIPLQIILKLVGNKGEVITTPFSYVATTSSILWENCKPVFVDINPEYLTIDEDQIEEKISDRTTCILATHVFGNPCNVIRIAEIAKKHGIYVIYDAAHCFGVKFMENSLFSYGDVSTCSFHATKLFHTGEGGAIFCRDNRLLEKVFYSHNFGHNGPLDFHGLGINAKMSELQAAMGLSVLPHFEFILSSRKRVVDIYNSKLNFNRLKRIKIRDNTEWNFSYYPIIFESEEVLLIVQNKLKDNYIYFRRYFYPSLNSLPFLDYEEMIVSESISKKIACLPLYHSLTDDEVSNICQIINNYI